MSLSRFTRRQFLQRSATLGAAIGMTSLAGCRAITAPTTGSGGETAPDAAEELLFWKPPHSRREAELWPHLLARFTDANPGITVTHQVISWQGLDEQLTAAFAGGLPPDLFFLNEDTYPKYASQGQIADLTDYIGDRQDQYQQGAWNIATYKGSVWGAPFLGSIHCFGLNMDLFNEAGIAVPTNWEEFRVAAHTLTDIDAGVYGLNITGVPDFAIVFLLPLLAVGGTQLLSDDLLSVAANTAGGVAAFRALLEEIVYLDQSSTPLSFAPEQRRELGLTGRIAISWREQAGVKENLRVALPDTEFDAIPMLQLTEDGQHAISSSTGLMFVAQQPADKPEAFALLDFLAGDEIQVDYVQKSVDLLPLKNGIPPLEDVDPLVAKMVSFLDAGYGVGSQASIHWHEATNSLVQEALAVMSGIKTPEQALADVEATVAPILDGE